MGGPENLEQGLEANLRRIELELDDFGVARLSRADLLVGGIGNFSSRVTGDHGTDALQALKYGLGAPKTASAEGDALRGGGFVGSGFGFHGSSGEGQRQDYRQHEGEEREEAGFHNEMGRGETTRA